MKRDFRGRFASKGRSINKFVTITVWEGMKYAVMGIVVVAVIVVYVQSKTSTKIALAETQIVTVEAPREIPPVLKRIAKCESTASQKGKNGQINFEINTDRTIDVGKYQINSIHFAEATKLGYDVFTEEGNEKFALWLYENKGTEPWYSTKKCWNK